jgi:hypothetical protein
MTVGIAAAASDGTSAHEKRTLNRIVIRLFIVIPPEIKKRSVARHRGGF